MSRRELLIDEVKKFPILYNTRHENHKDMELRERCWLEISQRLGENSEVLKREWKILRDSLRQVVKKRGKVTKSGASVKKWRFESKMAFLLPFMTERVSGSSRSVHAAMKAAVEDDDDDVGGGGGGGGGARGPKPGEALEDDKPDYWEDTHTHFTSQADPLELFFSSVCESTKQLPRELQARVRREVLDVVLRAEEDHRQHERQHDRQHDRQLHAAPAPAPARPTAADQHDQKHNAFHL